MVVIYALFASPDTNTYAMQQSLISCLCFVTTSAEFHNWRAKQTFIFCLKTKIL
jgi:hypothetical protein